MLMRYYRYAPRRRHYRRGGINWTMLLFILAVLTFVGAQTTTFFYITPEAISTATGQVNAADKIATATQPMKDILLGMADPVCYLVFIWGLLETMLGKGSQGLGRMRTAALGYIGISWLPVFMEMLRATRPGM